jgi:hypothetical protein
VGAIRQITRRARHFFSPPEEIFLKQYGERRTGTNFIRIVLASNYANAMPLMHILGDKHSPPVDLNAHLERARLMPDPEWEFVCSATYAAPAESTKLQDAVQLEHMKAVARSLASGVRERRLGFLISLKHPRPWAVSIANYLGWVKNVNGRWGVDLALAPELESVCKAYNSRHEAWLAHYKKNESRSVLIHHEKLLNQPVLLMEDIEDKFNLRRKNRKLELPEKKAQAADWDHQPSVLDRCPFDPGYYRDKRYEEVLGPELWAVVERVINWDLMSEFGYGKLP